MEKMIEEQILKDISQKFDLKKRDSINYKKFIDIYHNYSNCFTELEFADLLGINHRNYKKFSKDNKIETFIFMNQELTQEEKEEQLIQIVNNYQLYKGKEITLSFFQKMYDTIKVKLTEVEFADLLGIKKYTYEALKKKSKENKNAKTQVLMKYTLSKQEKMQKLVYLVNQYNLYKDKRIDYDFFKVMYEIVKISLTEYEFANLLGISDTSLKNIRKEGTAKLFRNVKLGKDVIEAIRKKLIKEYEGKSIYYGNKITNGEVDFLELFRPYRVCFTENELAALLGISEKNLWYTKNEKANPKIKDIKKIEKVEELKKEIIEGRYYTKDEIDEMCQKLDLSIDDFITYYINKGKYFDSSEYKKAIEYNKRLWIGKVKIEDNYIKKYNEMFKNITGTIANDINKKFGIYYLEEDIKSAMLLYIISECGDIILNFDFDEKLMERMLWLRARKYGQIKYIEELKREMVEVVLKEEKIPSKENLSKYYEKIDIDTDINTDTNKMDKEKLITLFKNYLEQGYDKETIIENISRIFKIQKTEMLEMMKQYLLEKGKVVQNKNGDYEIGEQ